MLAASRYLHKSRNGFFVNEPVGYQDVLQSSCPDKLSGVKHVLIKCNRFCIGISNRTCSHSEWLLPSLSPASGPYLLYFSDFPGRSPSSGSSDSEGTSRCSNGKTVRSREEMKQRLFLDGIDMDRTRISVCDGI